MNDVIANLSRLGVLSAEGAAQARDALTLGEPPDDALRAAMNGTPEEKLLRCLAEYFHFPFVDLESAAPTRELISRFPARLLLHHRLLPVREEGGTVLVATSRVFDGIL